jgi:hypothetical protein
VTTGSTDSIMRKRIGIRTAVERPIGVLAFHLLSAPSS